jgi:hypothetical protein
MTMPSEAVWDELLAALAKNAEAFAAARPADDARRLRAALTALEDMIILLHQDRRVLEGRITAPLGFLHQIVEAAANGKHVKVLNPEREAKGPASAGGRELVQGALAACVSDLMLSGKSRDDAGQEVAKLCRKYKVKSKDGNDLIATQVIGFRKSCSSGEAPALARKVYDAERRRALPVSKKYPEAAQLRVGVIIQWLGGIYPTAAPNRRAARAESKIKERAMAKTA